MPKKTIFYDGKNGKEVVEFFKDDNFGRHICLRKNGQLHYKTAAWQKDIETLIKPNHYIMFDYDEEEWWYKEEKTREQLEKDFIKIEIN